MRVRRLDLIRYGRFTDESVELPSADPDLHIVVGPNEAGKSTVMSALEDLLFGIPARSTLDFLHSYKDMRIGAELESDGRSLEVQRRKGMKNTLLSADGGPFPNGERALARFVGKCESRSPGANVQSGSWTPAKRGPGNPGSEG